jgi:hypothetical protein
MNHRPSTRLNYSIWRSIHSKGVLFGLARDKGAVGASPDYAVENENRYSVLFSLDYIPSLSYFTYQVAGAGKWDRGLDLAEITEAPKTWSTATDIPEAPFGGKRAHRACAKHEEDVDNPKKKRHRGDRGKELEYSHSRYSDSLTP